MNAMQMVLIVFQPIAAILLIIIGGVPDRKTAPWYLLVGVIFLIIAALVGIALNISVRDAFSFEHARISIAVPLSLGYPFVLVGILGFVRTMRQTPFS